MPIYDTFCTCKNLATKDCTSANTRLQLYKLGINENMKIPDKTKWTMVMPYDIFINNKNMPRCNY